MATVSGNFTAAGQVSSSLRVERNTEFTLVITGTFSQVLYVERSNDLQTWEFVRSFSSTQSSLKFPSVPNTDYYYRMRCFSRVSGTSSYQLDNVAVISSGTYLELAGGTMSGALLLDDGSEAAPGLAFGTDTDCGLRRVGANALALVVAGADLIDLTAGAAELTGAMTITNSSGPHLTIKDGGTAGVNADPYIRFNDTSTEMGYVGFPVAASLNMYVSNLKNGDLILGTNNTNYLTIDNAGAHELSGTLTIVNSAGPHLTLKDGGTAGVNADPQIYFSDSGSTMGLIGYDNAASLNMKLLNAKNGDLILGTNNTNYLTIDNAGAHALTGSLTVSGQIYGGYGQYDAGNSGASITLDFAANGNSQKVTLTANSTFTFTAPSQAGTPIVLEVIQDGTGSRTVTWPGTVDWGTDGAPTLTTTASKADIISFLYTGSKYFGSYKKGFTP